MPGELNRTAASSSATGMVRIVLADDHEVVRRGLQLVLETQADFEVVAQAGNVTAAHNKVREQAPAVLVLDLHMPGGSSLEAIPKLRAECPATQIVVLTMDEASSLVDQAHAAGALGYVLKEAADAELIEAVRRAAAGERYLSPHLASRLVSERIRANDWS